MSSYDPSEVSVTVGGVKCEGFGKSDDFTINRDTYSLAKDEILVLSSQAIGKIMFNEMIGKPYSYGLAKEVESILQKDVLPYIDIFTDRHRTQTVNIHGVISEEEWCFNDDKEQE